MNRSCDPTAAAAKRWQPAPAIKASAWLHLAGSTALAVQPQGWPWIAAALAGNHIALGLVGLWPRSTLLGPNLLRLPDAARRRKEIALTFDDGPDPRCTPAVLELLDRYRAKASFFCIGRKAAAHPDVVRAIVRHGHSVENHSDDHCVFFGFYGLRRLQREIESAQDTLASITASPPGFFRAPAGIRSPLLDPVVARCGLRYVAWTRRGFDTVTRNPRTVCDRLSRRLDAGDILLLHDGACARAPSGRSVVLEVLPVLLERIRDSGLRSVSLPMAMR